MSAAYIPPGFSSLTPYLMVKNAAHLLAFMEQAFGAQTQICMQNENGGLMHASVRIGDAMLEFAEANDKWQVMPAGLHLYVPDCDATYAKAVAAGGTSLYEPADMFYGERSAGVSDPCGNHWYIATFKEEVPLDEIKRRHAAMNK